ncbi:CPBP family intramembrane glutamic endopeptidase [Ornithinibacillus halophilus]|uniref:CAAX prenyl protease 2/Lysostaphin resistance protein A-like domain-containing protein n=1 Tax=Ornithinibacillus halophilus TaxID=930117 RepID=A0A1M5HFT3_9BACI|nr:CPBP family intramembrane glutamic endopeptidase [Ornithinibacillus halophilus]SHG14793.1 hypothetical protein SAMN05216225_101741 [Ornithinibacillus halophilus]
MSNKYWWVIITYIIMQFSGVVFVTLLKALTSLSIEDLAIYSTYWSIFSFTTGLVVVLLLLRKDMAHDDFRASTDSGQVVLWSILGFVLAYFTQVFTGLFELYVLGIEPKSENTQMIMDITRSVPLFMIIPMFIAPILEEIIFRKIIFGSLHKHMNFFFAALLSAFIFGIIHGEMEHILRYAATGFVFAFLYVKTKRILVPIIVHMALNSFAVLIQYGLSPEDLERMQDQLKELQTILFG